MLYSLVPLFYFGMAMVSWTTNDETAYNKRQGFEQIRPIGMALDKHGILTKSTTDEDKLNKTERLFLEFLKRGRHEWVGMHCMTLKLADDCRYTPDFWAVDNGKLTAFEVKGFFRDDAKVKIKVAARMFPWIEFVLVRKNKLRSFDYEKVKP